MINSDERKFVQFLERINLVHEGIAIHGFGELTCGEARIVAKRILSLVDQQEMILKLRNEGAGIRDVLKPTTDKLTGY